MNPAKPSAMQDSPWHQRPTDELINHIIDDFHEKHRQQFPQLIALAQRLESAHAEHPELPQGLVNHLTGMQYELAEHMMKEEGILFPMMVDGMKPVGPISVMTCEHEDHFAALDRLKNLTNGFTPPDDACNTWQTLYAGLQELYDNLIEHIHLENDVLFIRGQ